MILGIDVFAVSGGLATVFALVLLGRDVSAEGIARRRGR